MDFKFNFLGNDGDADDKDCSPSNSMYISFLTYTTTNNINHY